MGAISVLGLGMLPNLPSLEDQSRIVSDRVGHWNFLHVWIGGSFVPH